MTAPSGAQTPRTPVHAGVAASRRPGGKGAPSSPVSTQSTWRRGSDPPQGRRRPVPRRDHGDRRVRTFATIRHPSTSVSSGRGQPCLVCSPSDLPASPPTEWVVRDGRSSRPARGVGSRPPQTRPVPSPRCRDRFPPARRCPLAHRAERRPPGGHSRRTHPPRTPTTPYGDDPRNPVSSLSVVGRSPGVAAGLTGCRMAHALSVPVEGETRRFLPHWHRMLLLTSLPCGIRLLTRCALGCCSSVCTRSQTNVRAERQHAPYGQEREKPKDSGPTVRNLYETFCMRRSGAALPRI